MPDNYSFLDETLAGSAIPYSVDDLDNYIRDGISHIFSLTPNLPLVSKFLGDRPLIFHHFPVYATPDRKQLEDFIAEMKSVKQLGEKAVVHCQYGQERTGIFLAAYLIQICGLEVNKAIARVRKQRPSSLQTHHAIAFLRDYYQR